MHRLAHWLFLATALWLAFGLLGTALSASRGEFARVRRGILSLLAVAAIYLGLLVALSLRQPAQVLPPGHSRCFGPLCFQVIAAEQPTGFRSRAPNAYNTPLPNGLTPDRLVRLRIRVANLDSEQPHAEPNLFAILIDQQGRRWQQLPGLSGVSLSTPVQHGGSIVSSPVFRVAPDSSGLRLLLVHRGWYSGRFTLGDLESLLHRPAEITLPAEESVAQDPETSPLRDRPVVLFRRRQ